MNKHAHELSQTILVAMALLLTAVWAGAAPVPVTTLPLPDGYSESEGQAVNNAGQVAGYCVTADDYMRACIWDNGACTFLDTADGVLDDCLESEAYGINASGQVIGVSYDVNNNYHGFFWQDGVMTALGALPGSEFSYPCAMNDAGQVIGSCNYLNGDFSSGFIWENGVMSPLVWNGVDRDGNPAQFPIDPNDINAAGQVVGTVRDPLNLLGYEPAVLWEDGVVTVLTPGESGYCCQINNNGWVVGERDYYGNPWLYVPGTGLRTVNISGQYPDGEFQWANISWLQGINDLNQTLIYSENNAYRQRLWCWEDDGTTEGSLTEIPLSNLMAPGEYTGWIYAYLNNAGQVAGYAQVQGQGNILKFFWNSATPDAIASLALPPDHINGVVNALNDAGLATGATSGTAGNRTSTWDSAATPANQAPIANAGPDQTVSTFDSPSQVQLDGTGTANSDGDVCRYTWSENGSTIATGARPSVSLTRGVHVLTLTVTDSYGASSSDTVTITVSRPASVFAVTVSSVVRKGKSITVTAEISNAQATTATDVTVTEATLGGVDTTSRLPLAVRTIRANSSKQCTLKFDSATVAAGTANFWIFGTSSQGNFYTQVSVTVP